MATAFNVGDMAVYPVQGVAEVMRIETLEISGFTSRFYVLKCLGSDNTIRVPLKNAEQVGLRNLVDDLEIGAVLDTLRNQTIQIEEPNWNRRQRRYYEKLQSGNLGEVAQVLRDLHLMSDRKELSYGERRVFENAMHLLVQELSVAQSASNDEVTEQIEQLLSI